MSPEKPGKLRIFFSYFVATLHMITATTCHLIHSVYNDTKRHNKDSGFVMLQFIVLFAGTLY